MSPRDREGSWILDVEANSQLRLKKEAWGVIIEDEKSENENDAVEKSDSNRNRKFNSIQ